MTKEEMEKQIHGFAELMYKIGFEDGHEKCKNKIFLESAIYPKAMKDGYNQGLEAVWKYVEKLSQLTIGEIYEIFDDECDNIFAIVNGYSPSEFIDAIKEYEEKQKKMRENCSILNDICPYRPIVCAECEVHCSLKRARNKIKELKGDKE